MLKATTEYSQNKRTLNPISLNHKQINEIYCIEKQTISTIKPLHFLPTTFHQEAHLFERIFYTIIARKLVFQCMFQY